MSNYYSREDAENLIKLEIQAGKEALEIIDDVIEVVKSFDGKVFNKRFETALQTKVSYNIHARNSSYGFFGFYYTIPNRSVKSVDHDYWNYLGHSEIYLITGDDTGCFTDENRICSNVMIAKINERREEIMATVKGLEEGLGKLDGWIERQRKLVDELQNLRDSIPYDIKEYVTELHLPHMY